MSNAVKQGTDAWHEARSNKVTASVVAALFGRHPFKRIDDLIKLLQKKKGHRRHEEKSLAMNWGTHFEGVAKRRYETAIGVSVEETGFWEMKNAPLLKGVAGGPVFTGGSPDGIVHWPDSKSSITSEKGTGIIEIKSPHTSKKPKQLVKDMMHVFQLILNMFCTDTKWAHFISYTPMGLTVEILPRPDQVSLGPMDFQSGEQETWTKQGVYDAATGTYPGYGRVFFQVIYNFFNAVTNNAKQISRHFSFDNYESIRLINAINAAMKTKGYIKPVFQDKQVIPCTLPSKLRWTSMMIWQIQYLVLNGDKAWLYRFGIIGKMPPRKIQHVMDLFPVQKPSWFNLSALCVDIIYKGKNAQPRAHNLTLDCNANGERQPLKYFPWQRRQLPLCGHAIVTLLVNGYIRRHAVVEWKLEDPNLDDACDTFTFFRTIQILPGVELSVDRLHRHVCVWQRQSVTASKDDPSAACM